MLCAVLEFLRPPPPQVSNCIKIKRPRSCEKSICAFLFSDAQCTLSTERRGRAEIKTKLFIWGLRIAVWERHMWAETKRVPLPSPPPSREEK